MKHIDIEDANYAPSGMSRGWVQKSPASPRLWTIFFYRQTVTSACSAEPTTVLFIFGVTFFCTVSDIKVERFVKVNKENPWLIVVFIPLKKLSLTCIIYGNVTKCQWRVSDLIPLDQYGMCIINLSPKLFNYSSKMNSVYLMN